VDFDPDATYAPVARHEKIRMMINFAAAEGLILEGADISNAYLYGGMGVPILIEQPTDSSQLEARPGYGALIMKSIYGVRQAGKLWGSFLGTKLAEWNFVPSRIDPRLYFYNQGSEFIMLLSW